MNIERHERSSERSGSISYMHSLCGWAKLRHEQSQPRGQDLCVQLFEITSI